MLIGRVVGGFGVRGEMKVEPLTDFPDRFARLELVYIGPAHQPFRIESSRQHKGRVLLKVVGIGTPEQAAALHDQDVAIPREEAMHLPPGHYYLDDLVGMTVLNVEGEAVGHITDVLRTGSNDVYVVNEGRDSILVPAIRDAIRELDLENGRILVEQWALEPPT
jgi:16S rRNA processing protein RimM